jgi:hypothetical protein
MQTPGVAVLLSMVPSCQIILSLSGEILRRGNPNTIHLITVFANHQQHDKIPLLEEYIERPRGGVLHSFHALIVLRSSVNTDKRQPRTKKSKKNELQGSKDEGVLRVTSFAQVSPLIHPDATDPRERIQGITANSNRVHLKYFLVSLDIRGTGDFLLQSIFI